MENRAAPVPDRTFSFLLRHTSCVLADELTDPECCICLEPFTTEYPLRITGIQGCSHVFGSKCIKSILNNRPGTAKTCPLCRTAWIPSEDENEARPGVTVGAALGPTSRFMPGPRLVSANRLSITPHPLSPVRQEPEPALRHPSSSSSPIAISLGREGEGSQELTAETVASERRDIEDIRTRAAAHRLSRPRVSSFLSRIRATDGLQVNSEDAAPALLGQQPLASLTASTRRRVALESSDENEGSNEETRFPEQGSEHSPATHSVRTGIHRTHRFHMRTAVRPGYVPNGTVVNRSTPDRAPFSVPTQNALEQIFDPAVANSFREESNNIRELLMDFRERDLAERERKVDDRLKQVEKREETVSQQENALFQRQLQLNNRESKVNEYVEGMKRQVGEFDRLRAELDMT